MKKLKLLFSSILLLTSCSSSSGPYDCYQCYISNMIESSCTLSYDSINKKEIVHEDILQDEKYYYNYYIMNTEEEVESFYSIDNLQVDEKEKEKNYTLKENNSMIYFFLQIPKGYKAYRRNNIQQALKSGEVVLMTTNFYYYVAHPEIVYCFIDLKKDETITDNYVYSFYYVYDSYYSSVIEEGSIRAIYSLSED